MSLNKSPYINFIPNYIFITGVSNQAYATAKSLSDLS